MKKISFELTQVGTEDFVAQAMIKVKVNGQFVENDIKKIVDEAIDKNGSCEYRFYTDTYQGKKRLEVKVTTKSDKEKCFCLYHNAIAYDYAKCDYTLRIAKTHTPETIKEFLEALAKFVKEIEAWVFDTHSKSQTWFFEVG